MLPPLVTGTSYNLEIENFGSRNPAIPVTFTHEGKEYKGYFSEVTGMGGYRWMLNVNGFFRGTMGLMHLSSGERGPVDFTKPQFMELRFWTHRGDLDYLAEEFIDVIILWYQ